MFFSSLARTCGIVRFVFSCSTKYLQVQVTKNERVYLQFFMETALAEVQSTFGLEWYQLAGGSYL